MIVDTFLNPKRDAVARISSLNCDSNCKCGPCADKNGGIGSILDRGANTYFLCDIPGFTWFEMCRVPTREEIIADTSYYGRNLSLENTQYIEERTRELAPEYETDLEVIGGGINWWWVVGGLVGVILLKKI